MKGGSISILVAGFLAVLITVLFILYVPKCVGSCVTKAEGFADKLGQCKVSPVFSKCPGFTKSYIDSLGNMNCCEGEVMGNKCEKPYCSFNKNSLGLPDCKEKVSKLLNDASIRFCPKSLPNLYINFDTGSAGCTKGPLNANMDAPLNANDTFCIFWDSSDKGCEAMKKKELEKQCPFGTYKYTTENGDINCCGEVSIMNKNKCNHVTCTLKEKIKNKGEKIPCDLLLELIKNETENKSNLKCPKSMPNRYFRPGGKGPLFGCTSGEVSEYYYQEDWNFATLQWCWLSYDPNAPIDCRNVK